MREVMWQDQHKVWSWTGESRLEKSGHWGQTPIWPLGMCWVHGGFWNKIPSTEPAEGGVDLPTGFILINFTFCPQFAYPNTHWTHIEYFYKVPTQIPTDHQAGCIQKVPTKNPVDKCWLNYEQNPWFLSQLTQKVPGRNFVKEPLGFFQKWPHDVLVMRLSRSLWVWWGII